MQAEMWQTKNALLQREMCELTARLYEEKERSLCLELCLKEMERKVGGAFAGPGPCNQVHLQRQPNLCCVVTAAPVLALVRACSAKMADLWPSICLA